MERERRISNTWSQSRAILQYWRALVRHEEAMLARPRARRNIRTGDEALELFQPTTGRAYFKIALDAQLQALVTETSDTSAEKTSFRPLTLEIGEYFETWLAQRYRQGGDERGSAAHMLAFPIVHLANGELAGLFRVPVDVDFVCADEKPFKVPSPRMRRARAEVEPPVAVRVALTSNEDDDDGVVLPMMLDTRLLVRQLGMDSEAIDELFERLRGEVNIDAERMLEVVTQWLSEALEQPVAVAKPAPPGGDDVWPNTTALVRVVAALLARRDRRVKVFPVAIVLDASRAITTWHLQRDLEVLLGADREGGPWRDGPLCSYLSAVARSGGDGRQRCFWGQLAPTASQAEVARKFWGAQLSAVSGPPGTGKTATILHICSEALARGVDALIDGDATQAESLVVASTNNRAVDNVIDVLCDQWPEDRLPLALRAGSRDSTEKRLVPQLRRVQSWLRAAIRRPRAEREARARASAAGYQQIRGVVDAPWAAYLDKQKLHARRSWLEAELARASGDEPSVSELPSCLRSADANKNLSTLIARLELLSDCARGQTKARLSALERQFDNVERQWGERLMRPIAEQATGVGSWPLPPKLPNDLSASPARAIELWEEAIEDALALLEELRDRLRAEGKVAREREQRAAWSRELDKLRAAPGASSSAPETDFGLAREMFTRALEAREDWAAARAENLAEQCELLLSCVENSASWRAALRDRSAAARQFQRVFHIWGCTLLSLGNCFPPEQGVITRIIVDEAGQCHPAHAISALLRAESAMMLGDVHQLEPVIEVSAQEESRVRAGCKLRIAAENLARVRVHSRARVSAQTVADAAVLERGKLVDHFRCQPEIIAISDRLCDYGLTVHTPSHRDPALARWGHPVAWLEVPGQQVRMGGSWGNHDQGRACLEVVESLGRAGIDWNDVAIITPYRAQLELLRRALVARQLPLDTTTEADLPSGAASGQGIAVGTVHRFQGGERRVVVFCTVVTRTASLEFMDGRPNLLNVAVSRAREQLIVIGDRSALSRGRRTRHLVEAAHIAPV